MQQAEWVGLKWLTVHQVAHVLGLSERTIYRWCRAGTIPVHRIGGRWRFERGELEKWAGWKVSSRQQWA